VSSRICDGGHLHGRNSPRYPQQRGSCDGCGKGENQRHRDLNEPHLTLQRSRYEQKVTGKLLDLSLTSSGGEGLEAWTGGGAEKIFLLNK
jgi:hypothetical protein